MFIQTRQQKVDAIMSDLSLTDSEKLTAINEVNEIYNQSVEAGLEWVAYPNELNDPVLFLKIGPYQTNLLIQTDSPPENSTRILSANEMVNNVFFQIDLFNPERYMPDLFDYQWTNDDKRIKNIGMLLEDIIVRKNWPLQTKVI